MSAKFKYLLIENRDQLRIIKINNPVRKNALNRDAYAEMTEALNEAAADASVAVVALTGVGDFYTSGNDLSQRSALDDFEKFCREANDVVKALITAFIEFPKVLVAVVNGPCIGIGATTAALCDVIYCSEEAYFYTPFTKLGLCPEGCSTYTFPKLLGTSKATEMLLLDVKLTASEALQYKFVSEIFHSSELETKIWPKLIEYSKLPPGALKVGKSLIRKLDRDELYKALNVECEELYKRYFSDEFMNALMTFMSRKSKL